MTREEEKEKGGGGGGGEEEREEIEGVSRERQRRESLNCSDCVQYLSLYIFLSLF
jgi:hypothetical protein